MTLDQIEQMVRAANPVPDVTALDSPDVGNVTDLEPSPREQTSRRSRVVALAAVTAAMILVAAAVLLADRGEHTTGIEPANPSPSTTASTVSTTTTTPFLGSAWLPPQEAPSLPITGELVAAINIRHRGVYRLYADGRLIQVWSRQEQRLTPEGVERVRNRFFASGLFDSSEPISNIDGYCVISACVRDGDHWLQVQVDTGGPLSVAPPEAVDLYDDLAMLQSWLPESEWVDSQVKPHVSGLIGTCFSMSANGVPAAFDRSALLSRFPAGAAEVLAAHERIAETERRLAPKPMPDGYYAGPGIEPQSACFELPLEEARTLADALLAPSGGGTHDDGIELGFAHAWFFPLLPDKWPFDVFGD